MNSSENKHLALCGKLNIRKTADLEAYLPEDFPFRESEIAFFSEKVLNDFVLRDMKHGQTDLIQNTTRSLSSFSTGEKRKILLEYLLAKNPAVLVLESPFDALDKKTVERLKERLQSISEKITIIQILSRKTDLLPFIKRVIILQNQEKRMLTSKDFLEDKIVTSEELISAIPAAPNAIQNIPEILIQMRNVMVHYEAKPILKDITWEIKRGEFWQLIGPNGAGKTTVLSMIYGDNVKAYGQEIYIFGNKKGSGESVWELKNKIGYFSPALVQGFNRRNTVSEMLISGLLDSIGLYERPTFSQQQLAQKWLKVLELEQKAKAIFVDLPILEQRLLLIARAMIKHPPLLILDEPTTVLDDAGARRIVNLINKIAAETTTAIIYVSHRKENGLNPDFCYELNPTPKGAEGKVV